MNVEKDIDFEKDIESIIENLKKDIEYSFKKLNSEKRQLRYLNIILKEQSKLIEMDNKKDEEEKIT